MRRAILLLAVAIQAFGQAARGVYTYEKETSLSGTAETVTIHLPASATDRNVRFIGASVFCSVACTPTLARDGAAPTATAGAAGKLNGTTASSSVVPYSSSNVGAGTHIKKYNVAAGLEQRVELPDKGLVAGENVTITTGSLTGTVRIYFQWREF